MAGITLRPMWLIQSREPSRALRIILLGVAGSIIDTGICTHSAKMLKPGEQLLMESDLPYLPFSL